MPERDFFAKLKRSEDYDRAIRCVNALGGIDDPEAWVAEVRGVLERARTQAQDDADSFITTHGRHLAQKRFEQIDRLLKQLNTPGPKEGAHEQDARGGFERKDGE